MNWHWIWSQDTRNQSYFLLNARHIILFQSVNFFQPQFPQLSNGDIHTVCNLFPEFLWGFHQTQDLPPPTQPLLLIDTWWIVPVPDGQDSPRLTRCWIECSHTSLRQGKVQGLGQGGLTNVLKCSHQMDYGFGVEDRELGRSPFSPRPWTTSKWSWPWPLESLHSFLKLTFELKEFGSLSLTSLVI